MICNIPDLFVYGIEQSGEVVLRSGNKQFFQPFRDGFFYCVYCLSPLSGASPMKKDAPYRFVYVLFSLILRARKEAELM